MPQSEGRVFLQNPYMSVLTFSILTHCLVSRNSKRAMGSIC